MCAEENRNWSGTYVICAGLAILSVASLAYLNLAGTETEYGNDRVDPAIPGVLHPAWDIGWPLRYAVLAPNFHGPSWRWIFAPAQNLATFLWSALLIDISTCLAVTLIAVVGIQAPLQRYRPVIRLWHLMALIAWLACGLAMMLQFERSRVLDYDPFWDEAYPQSEVVKRLLFDDQIALDYVASAIGYVALGMSVLALPDFVRLCSAEVRTLFGAILPEARRAGKK